MVYSKLKRSQCKKKTLLIKDDSIEFYECPDIDYYSYKTINGKRFLFRGKVYNTFAYYHELGHLIYDNFLIDILIASSMVLPIFLIEFPWSLLTAILVYILTLWHKKTEERRADLFANEATGLKYTSNELERNKIVLLFHWLFWSHPPEKVRISEEYYKKEIPLIRLFLNSFQ